MKSPKYIITLAVIGFIIMLAIQACGAPRSHCNTKGKTRVEMGFM